MTRRARDQARLDEMLVRALCRWFEAAVRKEMRALRKAVRS